MTKYLFGSASSEGLKRAGEPNQDSLAIIIPKFPNSLPPLLVIADGMGGYRGGETASKILVETLKSEYRSILGGRIPLILAKGLEKAHAEIKKIGLEDSEMMSMGSTVVTTALDGRAMIGTNVGDSRAYLINQKEIIQISEDHSMVAELVRAGQLSPEEAHGHAQLNRLSQAISARRDVIRPYFFERKIRKDDIILLCSDGLWGPVAESQIWRVAYELEPQTAADKLVEMANSAGGPDNVTVIVARQAGNLPKEEESTGEFQTEE